MTPWQQQQQYLMVWWDHSQQVMKDISTSPSWHTFRVWLLFATLVGLYRPNHHKNARRYHKPLLFQEIVRSLYPIMQFLWMAMLLPLLYRWVPSHFVLLLPPPPNFLQKFLIDTTNLYQNHGLLVTGGSLFLAYWIGVLAIKVTMWMGSMSMTLGKHNDDDDGDSRTTAAVHLKKDD